MLRIIYSAYARPFSFPVDVSSEFTPGLVAQLTVEGNNTVATVSDGTAPLGIIDDIRTRSFSAASWDEEVVFPVPNPQAGPSGGLITPVDVKVELNNPNILQSTFVSDPVSLTLIPRNGVVIAKAGTMLNYDSTGSSTPDSIRTFVRYSYSVPNILGDNSTMGSGRMTVWLHRFIGETDVFDTTAIYPLNANLFVNKYGQLTTTQPFPDAPSVALVLGPPSALLGTLQFLWL